jgi:hypothetical protein
VLTVYAVPQGAQIPSQFLQNGKYLTTDGNNLSWATVEGGGGGGGSVTLVGTTSTLVWVMDGSGYIIPTGDKGVFVVPYNCFVTEATVIGNTAQLCIVCRRCSLIAMRIIG